MWKIMLFIKAPVLIFLCCVYSAFSSEYVYKFTDATSSYKITEEKNFPNDSVIFVELSTQDIYLPGVTVHIKIHSLTLDENQGDFLLIGPGNSTRVFYGSPCWMFVQSQKDQDVLVKSRDATLAFVTKGDGTSRYIHVEWNRNAALCSGGQHSDTFFLEGLEGTVTKTPPTTPAPTTPVSEAERKALILCFKTKPVSCKEFYETKTQNNFKKSLADRANQYVAQTKMDNQKRIISSDITAKCFVNDGETNTTRENNFLLVTIMDRRNTDLPAFTIEELREIIKDFNSPYSLGVAECRVFPNYWWWFWGSVFMLIIVIIVLSVCWKWSEYDFHRNEDDVEEPKNKSMLNGILNPAFEELYDTLPAAITSKDMRPRKSGRKSKLHIDHHDNGPESPPPDTPVRNSPLGRNIFNPSDYPGPETPPPDTPVRNSPLRRNIFTSSDKNNSTKESKALSGPETDVPKDSTLNMSPLPQVKVINPDAVSNTSLHLYEDPEKLRRQPSPIISLKHDHEEDIADTTL